MLEAVSQADKALHDTLVHRADGWAFDDLAELFGFARIPGIDVAVWRHALRAVAFGQRGTLGTTWAAVELGLRSDAAARTVQVRLDPAAPHAATHVSGTGAYASGFTCAWVGRLVRLRYHTTSSDGSVTHHSKVLYVTTPLEIAGAPVSSITFAQTPTSCWTTEPCAFAGLVDASLELLPYVWREPSPGPVDALPSSPPLLPSGDPLPVEWLSQPQAPLGRRCTIELEVTEEAFAVPPTYLLDPAGVDRATYPGQPDGGIIMDLFGAVNDTTGTLVEEGDPLGDGPAPVYLVSDDSIATLERYFGRVLAAGCRFTITNRDFCLFEDRGTADLLQDIQFNAFALGAVSDPRLTTNAAAPGSVQQQTVWPAQRAYVFDGGTTQTRRLNLVNAVQGPAVLRWTYASGAQPGLPLDDPESGEDLVLQSSVTGSSGWTEVWRAEAGDGPGWLAAEYSVPDGTTLYFRWRQATYTTGDNWSIGSIRVWRV